MNFQIGDVVMFMGHAYFVIDFDDDINLLILTDGISTTSEVDYEDVVKIGHDDTFERDILDRLNNIKHSHDEELRNNQLDLIEHLKAKGFYSNDISYLVTGKTKVDGVYLYCQIKSEHGYEWILVEELFDKFFR